MTLPRFLKSLKYSVRGLKFVFNSERNFRIQTTVGLVVMFLAFYLPLQSWQRAVLVLQIFLVLAMEVVNTALEYFSDLLKPRLHSYVYIIKDLMATAVLLTAVSSIIIGLIIFYPFLEKFFS